MSMSVPIAAVHIGCRVPENASTPPGGHLAGPRLLYPERKTGRTRIVRQFGRRCAGGASQRGRLHGGPVDGRACGQKPALHFGASWPTARPDAAHVVRRDHGEDSRAVHAEPDGPGARDRHGPVDGGEMAQQGGGGEVGEARPADGGGRASQEGEDGLPDGSPRGSVAGADREGRSWSACRTSEVGIARVCWSARRTSEAGIWFGTRTIASPLNGPSWSARRTQDIQGTRNGWWWRSDRGGPRVHRGAERAVLPPGMHQVGSAAQPSPDGCVQTGQESDRGMKVTLLPVDVAQCAACGGLLVAAGDDWLHEENTGCTALGTPVICRRPECAMPAAVGCEACAACIAAFSSAEGVGSQSTTATV